MGVYGIGYSGRSVEDVAAIAKKLDAIIVDIRFNPMARAVPWRGYTLIKTLGDQYVQIKAFGNPNYKNGQPIAILDYESGKEQIEATGKNIILLCVCKDPHICHRTVILDQLAKDGFEARELNPFTFPLA